MLHDANRRIAWTRSSHRLLNQLGVELETKNLAKLALRALLGGTCATLMTATISGVLVG